MRNLTQSMILFLFGILISYQAQAQYNTLFWILKNGKYNTLLYYLQDAKVSFDIPNQKGYTPLHVLIDHFVDEFPNFEKKYYSLYSKALNYDYEKCLDIIHFEKPDLNVKSPDGLTYLQYAAAKGKRTPTFKLLEKTGQGAIRDKDGNTLLHLATLAPPEMTNPNFWGNLKNALAVYGINEKSLNNAGQTPLTFAMTKNLYSIPHLSASSAGNSRTTKFFADLARKYERECPPRGTQLKFIPFTSTETILAKDYSGNNALDYAAVHNKKYLETLQNELSRAEARDRLMNELKQKIEREYDEVIAKNRQITQDYIQRHQVSSGGQRLLKESFQRTYYYSCDRRDKHGQIIASELEEPIQIVVTPSQVSISSLYHVYGAFDVEKSGYEMINGNKWKVYYFEQTANNSTYKGIMFPANENEDRIAVVMRGSYLDAICAY